MRPTIETARDLQRELGLSDVHVVWFDQTGYTMAHTDHERASIDLTSCRLHLWCSQLSDMPVPKSGWYTMRAKSFAEAEREFQKDDLTDAYVYEPIIA